MIATVARIFGLHNLSPQVFQTVFGEVLTLLIALEFNHTLQVVVTRQRGIVQARAIVLMLSPPYCLRQ